MWFLLVLIGVKAICTVRVPLRLSGPEVASARLDLLVGGWGALGKTWDMVA